LFIAFTIFFLLQIGVYKIKIVPVNPWQKIVEVFFASSFSSYEQVNRREARVFLSSIFVLFSFILLSNLV